MSFEDVWGQVQGLPDTVIAQVPRVLSEATKSKLARKTPEEVSRIVAQAIEEVNRGSVKPLDELIRERI